MALLVAGGLAAYMINRNKNEIRLAPSPNRDWTDVFALFQVPANKNKIKTLYPDPQRWGQASAHNNRFGYTPKMDIKALTSTAWPQAVGKKPWPIKKEAFMIAYRDALWKSEVEFGLGVQVLKNELFTGNRSQMNAGTHLIVPVNPPNWSKVPPPTQVMQ